MKKKLFTVNTKQVAFNQNLMEVLDTITRYYGNLEMEPNAKGELVIYTDNYGSYKVSGRVRS